MKRSSTAITRRAAVVVATAVTVVLSSAAIASAEQTTSRTGARAAAPVFTNYAVSPASWVDHGSTVVSLYTTPAVDTQRREASVA